MIRRPGAGVIRRRKVGDVFLATCLAVAGLSVVVLLMLENPASRLSRWLDGEISGGLHRVGSPGSRGELVTGAQVAAVVALGVIAWVGLAICVAVAIDLTIREADRRAAAERTAAAPAQLKLVAEDDRRGTRLDVRA